MVLCGGSNEKQINNLQHKFNAEEGILVKLMY